MNEHNEINNENNEIEKTAEISPMPEAPMEEAASPENESTPPKSRSKIVKGIVLGVGLPLLALIIIFGALFLTLNPSMALQNTLESFGVNIRSLANLEQKFQKNGVKGYYNIEIPYSDRGKNSLLILRSDIAASPEKGKIGLTLSNSALTDDLTVNFVYNEKFIALDHGNGRYVGISLEDIKESLDASIFHPKSSSKYALKLSTYNDIISYLDDSAEDENSLDEETLEALEAVLQHSFKILKTEDRIFFSKEHFGLCKRVEYTINKETLQELSEYLIEQINENDKLDPVLELESIQKSELIDAIEAIVNDFGDDDYAKFSYTVYLGRIKNVTFSSYYKVNSTNSISNEIAFDFEYTSSSSEIQCQVREEQQTGEKINVDNTSVELLLKKSKNINTYTFKALDNTSNKSDSKNEGSELHGKLIHNTKDGKFYLSFGTTEEMKELYLEGNLLLNGKNGELRMTMTSFITEQMNLDWEIIDIHLKVLRSSPDTDVEFDDLFSMDDEAFEEYLNSMPLEKLDEIVSPVLGGNNLFGYSDDGKIILDSDALSRAYNKYSSAYKKYLSENLKNTLRCDYIFIYDEKLSLYFVMKYRTGSSTIYTNVYYELPEDVLKAAHEATLHEVYTDRIIIHKIEALDPIPATCSKEGKQISVCTVCGEEYYATIPMIPHQIEKKEISFTTDTNETCTGSVEECKVCHQITFVSDLVEFELTSSDEGYVVTRYSKIEYEYRSFSIPEEVTKGTKVVRIYPDKVYFYAKTLRIPDGLSTLESGCFNTLELQTLIIPSSLKEIKSGAFTSFENLHAVYYIGTEEEWKKVNLTEYEDEFSRIEIQFVETAPSSETVRKSLINIPTSVLITHISTESDLQATNTRIKNMKGLSSILQTNDNYILTVKYDPRSELIAALCRIPESTDRAIYVCDLKGKIKAEIRHAEQFTNISICDGYVVATLHEAKYLYCFNISTKEEKRINLATGQNTYLASAVVVDGKIYYTTNSGNKVSCYDLKTNESTALLTLAKSTSVRYIQEKEIIVAVSSNASKFCTYDLKTQTVKEFETDSPIFPLDQIYLPDYLITQEGIFYDLEGNNLGGNIPDDLIFSQNNVENLIYNFSICSTGVTKATLIKSTTRFDTVIQSKKMTTPFVIKNYYGGSAFSTKTGDVIFYTKYGVYLIKAE